MSFGCGKNHDKTSKIQNIVTIYARAKYPNYSSVQMKVDGGKYANNVCVKKANEHLAELKKLAKLGDVIAISKSETMNHSLTHPLMLGDAIASKKKRKK